MNEGSAIDTQEVRRVCYRCMASLVLNVKTRTRQRKLVVELDADQFERLAANFGFFSSEFFGSLARAEQEIAQGKVQRLRSLRQLRSA